MEKTKAFVASIGFGFVVAMLLYLAVNAGEYLTNFWVPQGMVTFISILVPCLITFPALGHIFVRQNEVSAKMIWGTSVLVAFLVVWVSLFLKSVLFHWSDLLLSLKGGSLPPFIWAVCTLPFTTFVARATIGLYLGLLDKLGVTAYFRDDRA